MITCTGTQLTIERCKRPKLNSSIEYRTFCTEKMNNLPVSSFCLGLNSSVRFILGNVQPRDHMHNHVEMLWQPTYTATWKIKSNRALIRTDRLIVITDNILGLAPYIFHKINPLNKDIPTIWTFFLSLGMRNNGVCRLYTNSFVLLTSSILDFGLFSI